MFSQGLGVVIQSFEICHAKKPFMSQMSFVYSLIVHCFALLVVFSP